jgi:magnesium-transporting ATPase (P-type)
MTIEKTTISKTILFAIVILFQIIVLPLSMNGFMGLATIATFVIGLVVLGLILLIRFIINYVDLFKAATSNFGLFLALCTFSFLTINIITNPYPFGAWDFSHYNMPGGGGEVEIVVRMEVYWLSTLVNIGLALALLFEKIFSKFFKVLVFGVLMLAQTLFLTDLAIQPRPTLNSGSEQPLEPLKIDDSDCGYRYRFMFLKMRTTCLNE